MARTVTVAALQTAFGAFGVALDDLAAVGVAVFDHGAAPPGTLNPEITGTRCDDGAPLEAGEYEVLVVAHAGGPDVNFHVIAPPTTITLVGEESR